MKPRRILLAEDDGIVAEDLRQLVESMGHRVVAVTRTGDGALGAAREHGVELALMDVRMPGGMDGIEAGRSLGAELGIPIVLVTAYSDKPTLERAKASDALAYLVKPVDPRELRTAIELALHRHEVEQRLRAARERFEASLKTLEDAVILVDPDARVTFMNSAAEKLTGVSEEEALGRRCGSVVRMRKEVGGDPFPDPVVAAMEGGVRVSLPRGCMLRCVDGSWIPVGRGAYPVRSADGRLLGGALVLQDARARGSEGPRGGVQRNRERHRTLFRESPVPTHVVTLTGARVLEVNRAFSARFGYRRIEVVGRRVGELDLWADPSTWSQIVQRVREDGGLRDLRARLRTRGGEVRTVELSATLLELDGESCVTVGTRDVTDRELHQAGLERMALYDGLTGLPNRNLLRDRLEHALERSRRGGTDLAVLFVDLDRFKSVNDTYGHAVGDQVLIETARRMEQCLRGEDTVGRLGGDEFVVVLESVSGPREAAEAARRVVDALALPFVIEGEPIRVGASVGICRSRGGAAGADDVLRLSDAAMYRAKERGGDGHRIFDVGEDGGPGSDPLRMGKELRRALDSDQLELRYQPIVRLDTGVVVGAEALVRWRHPARGLLAPADFIPLAEEAGLVDAVDSTVLGVVCDDLVRWRGRLQQARSFRLSFNASIRRTPVEETEARIAAALSRSALPPASLEIELSELAVVREPGLVKGLQRRGLRVAIDDYGVGYSSLACLKELRANTLKVDASFVRGLGRDPADAAVIRSALLLAKGLGMEVVAKGIETRAQLRRLLELGCGLGQGFHLSEPLTPAGLESYLEERGQLR